MKLPENQIEKVAAGTKDRRAYLRCVVLDVEKKTLTATDGGAMAVIPAEPGEGDTSGYVSLDAIKAARKVKASTINANGALDVPGVAIYPRPTADSVGRYPDVSRVIPKKPDRAPDLIIDAALLLRLAQALNANGTGVRLWIGTDNPSVLYAEPYAETGAYGALMLMRLPRD